MTIAAQTSGAIGPDPITDGAAPRLPLALESTAAGLDRSIAADFGVLLGATLADSSRTEGIAYSDGTALADDASPSQPTTDGASRGELSDQIDHTDRVDDGKPRSIRIAPSFFSVQAASLMPASFIPATGRSLDSAIVQVGDVEKRGGFPAGRVIAAGTPPAADAGEAQLAALGSPAKTLTPAPPGDAVSTTSTISFPTEPPEAHASGGRASGRASRDRVSLQIQGGPSAVTMRANAVVRPSGNLLPKPGGRSTSARPFPPDAGVPDSPAIADAPRSKGLPELPTPTRPASTSADASAGEMADAAPLVESHVEPLGPPALQGATVNLTTVNPARQPLAPDAIAISPPGSETAEIEGAPSQRGAPKVQMRGDALDPPLPDSALEPAGPTFIRRVMPAKSDGSNTPLEAASERPSQDRSRRSSPLPEPSTRTEVSAPTPGRNRDARASGRPKISLPDGGSQAFDSSATGRADPGMVLQSTRQTDDAGRVQSPSPATDAAPARPGPAVRLATSGTSGGVNRRVREREGNASAASGAGRHEDGPVGRATAVRDVPGPSPSGETVEAQPLRPSFDSAPPSRPRRANFRIETDDGRITRAIVRERSGEVEVRVFSPSRADAQQISLGLPGLRRALYGAGMTLSSASVNYGDARSFDRRDDRDQRPGRSAEDRDGAIFTLDEAN